MQNSISTDLSISLDDKAGPNAILRKPNASINRDANAIEINAVHMQLVDDEDERPEEEEGERLLPNNYARTRKEFVAQELYVLESDREDKIRHYSVSLHCDVAVFTSRLSAVHTCFTSCSICANL